ncbi:hypothetical protein PSDVSF_15510 [Pseudodesulfovibrio sediminis]|uniref:Rhodanese domain-containing protein n=2 Tax=Pseudodesulfovibrio sediminis TaxID=2810563 RepID=A0ABM7P675_9BACT|nr:hypothetical protein PSDVSF_15510 [Pseudodesulfovibrio sediminis]
MKKRMAAVLLCGLFILACAIHAVAEDTVPRMEAAELLTKLDSPEVIIIDVRREGDWNTSEVMIRNALRRSPYTARVWSAELPRDKTIVLYCA